MAATNIKGMNQYIMEDNDFVQKAFYIADTTFSKQLLPAFRPVDPVSALTHFIALLLCIPALPVLLIRACAYGAALPGLISLSVYMITMMLLYGASSAYHCFNTSGKVRRVLKKIDHAMIFLMIAGSYTPMCTIVLEPNPGYVLLTVVWGVAAVGVIFTICWIDCPKWISSVIYIAMGWLAVLVLGKLFETMPLYAFVWLVAGGMMYTVGGMIYALKFRLRGRLSELFGAHELFHLFVMAGSLCHYVMMFGYICSLI